MNDKAMLALMVRFRTAYGKADREALSSAISDDFEWHMHYGAGKEHSTGRVVTGVDGIMTELAWRKENWSNVRYSNMVERAAGDVILQMFTTSGINEKGDEYNVNVVDVYPVKDGRITRKDTYWKQP